MAAPAAASNRARFSIHPYAQAIAGFCLIALCLCACGGPNKKAAERHIKMALTQLDMRQYIAALEFLNKALDADPENRTARFLKAELLYNTARVEEAAKVMSKLYEEFPEDEAVRMGLAYMRKDQGLHEQALELFKSIPMTPALYHPVAECLTGVGKHDDAANMIGELLAADPWDPKAYLLFSRLESKRKRDEPAKLWGDFYRDNEKFREAERTALRAEHQGNAPEAALTRGRNLYRSGRLFSSMNMLEKVVQAQPEMARAYLTLGRILTDLGRSEDAIKYLEAALKLKPDMPNWQSRLAKAKEQLTQLADKPRSILDMAALYETQSKPDLVRAVVLFEANRDPKNAQTLRLVVKYFDRPKDAFIRLWAWRLAILADPEQAGFVSAFQGEAAGLGVDLKVPTSGS